MRGSFGNNPTQKITFGGAPMTIVGNTVEAGDWAPEFRAIKNDLSEFNSKENTGKVVVYSTVPSIDTNVCSVQTRYFNEQAAQFGDDVAIVSISNDLPFAQKRFCANEGIENSILVSDYRYNEFGENFGFLIDELKLLSRGIVIVDKENRVRYVEYVKEVTDEVDFNKALEVLKELV
ncbi:MAG: thiol peroxidase [Tissierellia bacterium]|nr:thiol peroxidase [Tissierellia bacterium]